MTISNDVPKRITYHISKLTQAIWEASDEFTSEEQVWADALHLLNTKFDVDDEALEYFESEEGQDLAFAIMAMMGSLV